MKIDRYTKTILTVIAVALMFNVVNPWIAPTSLEAVNYSEFRGIQGGLEYIADAIRNHN